MLSRTPEVKSEPAGASRPATGPADSVAAWLRSQPPALVVIGLVALALLLAWWLWGRGQTVKVSLAQRGDAAEVVYATGIVEPVQWAKVSSLQRKRIVWICDCERQAVRRGDVLVRLDDSEERALLSELEARLARYREDVERMRTLVERNVTSRTAYDDKLTQVREQEARVAAQKERIDDLVLRAPMDGVVLRRDGEVGEIAGTAANDVLLWVGQSSPLRVVAEINEDDIIRVEPGQRVLLRHEGHRGAPLSAFLESVTPKGDPQTKTFRAYLSLPPETPLKIGMSVEANVIVREAKGVLLVPAEAVGQGEVVVVVDGRLQRRPVEVGLRGTRLVEIRKGVAEGEQVVAPFNANLKAGARARLEVARQP